MTSLTFVIPAHRRYDVSAVSFAGIHWTAAKLESHGINVTVIVVADDANLTIAAEHGFVTLNRPNLPLGRKWNDGIELAASRGADYIVPCGSDNWVHPNYLLQLLPLTNDIVGASRHGSVVRDDGREIAHLNVTYPGGEGVRILPASLLSHVDYRPANDKLNRAIDGSMRDKLERATGKPIVFAYAEVDPLMQIVGFQSAMQLTRYAPLVKHYGTATDARPWRALRSIYPDYLVDMAEKLYQ